MEMGKGKGKTGCLEFQIYTEPCPQCGKTDQVYVGHGTVRYCNHCVISWDVAEVVAIQTKTLQAAFRADSPQPDPVQQERLMLAIQDTAVEIRKASALDDRISKLLDISDSDWEKASNG